MGAAQTFQVSLGHKLALSLYSANLRRAASTQVSTDRHLFFFRSGEQPILRCASAWCPSVELLGRKSSPLRSESVGINYFESNKSYRAHHNITFLRALTLTLKLDPEFLAGNYTTEKQLEGKKGFAAIYSIMGTFNVSAIHPELRSSIDGHV
jgi:hypothetical protein